jgi:hypothetical protein
MIWLEMISIRTAGTTETEKVLEICRECLRPFSARGPLTMKVYCSAKYKTDISIHFQWKSDPGPGSILGMEVISALKELGLVNHTLWIERGKFITGTRSEAASAAMGTDMKPL